MSAINLAQCFCLLVFAYIPVWGGKQAMRCFDQGHVVRSVLCIWVAMALNVGIFFAGIAVMKYNLSFFSILQWCHL